MRTVYILAGLVAVGLVGVVGWATLGSAQPVFDPPIKNVDPQDGKQPRPSVPPPIPIPEVPSQPIGKPLEPAAGPKQPVVQPSDAPIIIDPFALPKSADPTKPQEPLELKIPNLLPEPVDKPNPEPTGDIPAKSVRLEQGGLGKSEPSVSLEWVGPNSVKVGTPNDYGLIVRNTCSQPAQKVSVQMRLPAGVTIVAMEPKGENVDGVTIWETGTLEPRQEKRIALKMMAPQRGDIACQAWVTFTGSVAMKVQVREPKLVVRLQASDKALVGDPANFVLTVSNPGDHPTEKITITATLAEGLESVRGNKVRFDVGTLIGGASRTVTIPCIARAIGRQKCDVLAEASDGLSAQDSLALEVVQPRLDLSVTGPKLRYEGKKGTYSFKVANPGDAPAASVFVTEFVPNGFKFVQADNGGLYDDASRTVRWFVGDLAAKESREVTVELLAVAQGEFTHKVIVNASRGMKAEQEFKAAVEGISAVNMVLVDTDDPVEVGSDSSYEIRIVNTGTKAETDVKLVCTLPPQLKLKNVSGPLEYEMVGGEIVFQPLPRLAPRADVIVKVTVTATTRGDARFKASLSTASIVEPVTKVEATRVYSQP